MKRKVNFRESGHRADIGPYVIYRMLANRYVESVGPFVFLDHAVPIKHAANEPHRKPNGEGAHPHRGIATLTYVLNGEADHFDSKGHRAKVYSGGAQWMKAGNGIIHDEAVNPDPKTNDLLTHVLQFWINLPSKNKAERPEYLPVQSDEIPKKELKDNVGWLKVVVGQYDNGVSKIPNYSKQFIYHIHLEAGKKFELETEKELEYAAILPVNDAIINDTEYRNGELIGFDNSEGIIEIRNKSKEATDIIVFGGEPYTEPIVAQGPFVMNTEHEISKAYNDFYDGKYGEVKYN